MNDETLMRIKEVADSIAKAFEAGKAESSAGTAARRAAMNHAMLQIKAFGMEYAGDDCIGKRAAVCAFVQTRAVNLGWSDKTTGVRQADAMLLLDNAAQIPNDASAWRPTVDKIRRGKKSPLENLRSDLAAEESALIECQKRIDDLRVKIANLEIVDKMERGEY